MAASDVSTGLMTPGDFVMLQTYFSQLASPLFLMGTFFREVEQSRIDVEEHVQLFQTKPTIKDGALEFKAKSKGTIEFNHVYFAHEKKTWSSRRKEATQEKETLKTHWIMSWTKAQLIWKDICSIYLITT